MRLLNLELLMFQTRNQVFDQSEENWIERTDEDKVSLLKSSNLTTLDTLG
jgi:hypothetical protein